MFASKVTTPAPTQSSIGFGTISDVTAAGNFRLGLSNIPGLSVAGRNGDDYVAVGTYPAGGITIDGGNGTNSVSLNDTGSADTSSSAPRP